MPKMEIDGLEQFGGIIQKFSDDFEGILKRMVYDGAHEVFIEVQKEIRALPTSTKTHGKRDPSPEQVEGLLGSLYGSRIQTADGGAYEHINFTGYNNVRTKHYPGGQPNILIARCIESGATYMNKRPFMTRAAKNARARAIQAMNRVLDQDVKAITD